MISDRCAPYITAQDTMRTEHTEEKEKDTCKERKAAIPDAIRKTIANKSIMAKKKGTPNVIRKHLQLKYGKITEQHARGRGCGDLVMGGADSRTGKVSCGSVGARARTASEPDLQGVKKCKETEHMLVVAGGGGGAGMVRGEQIQLMAKKRRGDDKMHCESQHPTEERTGKKREKMHGEKKGKEGHVKEEGKRCTLHSLIQAQGERGRRQHALSDFFHFGN